MTSVCVLGWWWSQPNARAESSDEEENDEAAARPGARLVGVAAVRALTVLRRRGLSTAAAAVAEASRRDESRRQLSDRFPTLARVQLPRDQAMRVRACLFLSRRFAFVWLSTLPEVWATGSPGSQAFSAGLISHNKGVVEVVVRGYDSL